VNRPSEPAVPPVQPAPLVVPLIGLPGAGKTVVARHLVAAFGMRLLCRDSIRAAMFPTCRYSLTEKRAAFRALLVGLEVNCALGESSVIDGLTFSRAEVRERVAEQARRCGARLLPLWLDVPPHVARSRVMGDIARGGHLAADRTPELIELVLREFETPEPGTPAIDASRDADQVCREVEALVRAVLAPAPHAVGSTRRRNPRSRRAPIHFAS
jgi:predicted kinase